MKSVLKTGLILSVILLMAQNAIAQEDDDANIASINVYPTSKEIFLSRGETERGVYVAHNVSGKAQKISIKPRNWFMTEANESIPVESWLTINPTEFEIGPGEKKEIEFIVKIPEEASGEMTAMIAFKPEKAGGQSINVVFSVSLYARIKDSLDIGFKINDFKLWKYKDRKAIGTVVSLENTGNIHLRPKVTVYIENLFGKVLNRTPTIGGRPVYPGKTKDYSGAIYNFGLEPGMYKARISFSFSNTPDHIEKRIYFIVGKNGEILFVLFKKAG